ncbi:Kinetochore protein Spc24 [Microbotryomycetes sp. JL201]|nr:Kinetochore protein Spc24 [Microbotryomycetes sp. JL201]
MTAARDGRKRERGQSRLMSDDDGGDEQTQTEWADDGHDGLLSINKDFADKYHKKKQTEELSKLQDKYGKDMSLQDLQDDSEDSESLSDDDSDAELVTPAVDAAILRTLAKIRNKDPSVYEQGRQVFDEEESAIGSSSKQSAATRQQSKPKPVLLKDYQRQRVLADPTLSVSDNAPDSSFQPLTHRQEELALKDEVKKAFMGSDSDQGEDDGDDLLVARDKTKDQVEEEEREYAQFLKENAGGKAVEDALAAEDRFLKEYILNRGWIDREANDSRIPSYAEITGGDDREGKKKKKKKQSTSDALARDQKGETEDEDGHVLDPGAHDSEDSEYEEKADDFEYRYNFRFEDPEGTQMTTHARNAVSTVRKPTTAVSARARAREAAKERKEQEKQARKEEIRRLKALKRKQVEDKLLQLVQVAGQGTKGLEELDLEGDWDPEEHDRKMAQVYGEEYGQMEDDDFKPTWDDDIDITDIVGHDEDADADAAMSLPFVSGTEKSSKEEQLHDQDEDAAAGTTKSSKRKDKKRKRDEEGFPAELMSAAREQADDDQRQMLDKLEDEYYGIDYEDKIAGGEIKTRFKYAKVEPNDFSLTPREILLATDNELNEYMSLKKLAPYRQKGDVVKRNKKKLKELKAILKDRVWGEDVDVEWSARDGDRKTNKASSSSSKKRKQSEVAGDGSADGQPVKKKRPGKSERKRKAAVAVAAAAAEANGEAE